MQPIDKKNHLEDLNRTTENNVVTNSKNDEYNDPSKKLNHFFEECEVEIDDIYKNANAIIKAMCIKPGMTVADIGAASGFLAMKVSKMVGETGIVYASDPLEKFINLMRQRFTDSQINNVIPIHSSITDPCLDNKKIEIGYLVNAYRHIEYPKIVMKKIFEAIVPGGSLILVDYEKKSGVSSGCAMGHIRASKEVFRSEIEAIGFKFVEEIKIPGCDENYFIRFKKPFSLSEKLYAVAKTIVKFVKNLFSLIGNLFKKIFQAKDPKIQKWVNFIEGYHRGSGDIVPKPFHAVDKFVTHYLPKIISTKPILDIGCETGKNAIPLLQAGEKVTLVDIAPNAIHYTIENLKKLHLTHGVVESFNESIEIFDPLRGPFKAVVGTYAFSFIPPSLFNKVMKQNVLASIEPDGYFVGGFFGIKHSWAQNANLSILTEEKLHKLFKSSGFTICEVIEKEENTETVSNGKQLFHTLNVIAKKTLE